MSAALGRLRAKLRAWFFRRKADEEMAREMQSHLALLQEDLERQGFDPASARRAAQLRFGSDEAARESHRDARGFARLDALARDTRLAARSLRRAPAFTFAAVLTLGLGMGACMAVFTVVNSVLLEPLPYPESGQLAALRQFAPGAGPLANSDDGLGLSASMVVTDTEHNHSFVSMGAWDTDTASVTGVGAPEEVRAVEVSNGLLQTLGIPPLLGRWFGPQDHDPHRAPTVILAYGYWQSALGGDPGVLGRSLTVDGKPRVIVGVMPPGFRIVDQDADLIVPFAWERRGLILAGFGLHGVARLRPGVSLVSADTDLKRLLGVWMDSWSNGPHTNPHFYERWHITPAIEPLKNAVVGGVAAVLWAVMATIALVMLIAAGNVTNLFLVRAEARQHELAIRAALGAGRARIARALLLESALIALAGCGLGLGAAAAAVHWVRALGPANLPRLSEIAINGRVVLFGMLLASAVAVAAGLAPLWHRGERLAAILASETRSASGSRQRRRTRTALSIVQVAMALMLLLAAGLLIRTVAALRRVEPGVRRFSTLQTFRVSIPPVFVPGDVMVMRTENQILDQLAQIPGVTSAGLTDSMPMQDYGGDWDIAEKRGALIPPGGSPPSRRFVFISPGYLQTAGTRLLAGRDFSWADLYQLHRYVMVSGNLAREFWGGAQAALGQQLSPSGDDNNWFTVIGVVEDVRQDGAGRPAPTTVYWPALSQGLWGRLISLRAVTIAVRTPQADTAALRARIQQAVAAVNPGLPIADYSTMQQIYDRSLAVPSFTMIMLSLAGAMALALGLVGIYGVIAYDVSQRRREIGIRMALGASRGAVGRIFVRQGLTLALAGGAAGFAAAALLARSLRSLLYGVGAFDPTTFLAAPAVLLAAVVLASYLPARRASRLEPTQVLRD